MISFRAVPIIISASAILAGPFQVHLLPDSQALFLDNISCLTLILYWVLINMKIHTQSGQWVRRVFVDLDDQIYFSQNVYK